MTHTERVFDSATQNWLAAVQTYRASVDVYKRVLELRAGRAARGGVRASLPATTTALPRLPSGGQSWVLNTLSARECEVARLIAHGYTNQQIADALIVTRGTVANHVAHILAKLGLANRTQVAACLLAVGSPAPTHARDAWLDQAASAPS